MHHFRVADSTSVESIFMQINEGRFNKLQLWIYVVEKYVVITVFLGFLLLSHVYASVLSSFLQDCE